MRPLALLDAPSNLGLRPPSPGAQPGVREAPRALRDAGLLRRLGAEDAGEVAAPSYHPDRRASDGQRNAEGVAAYAGRLAQRIGDLLDAGRFPVVVGGDCSILLGAMLALRRQGPAGLLFVDGHLDFRHPGNSSALSAAAGEELAIVTGRGPVDLTTLDDHGPLVRDDLVVALGEREGDLQTADATEVLKVIALGELRATGPEASAADALEHLRGRGAASAWLHFDVDVIDSALMPAVDSPAPDGLSWDEVRRLLSPLVADPLVVGAEVTIFDPELDPDGTLAQRLVDELARLFAPDL